MCTIGNVFNPIQKGSISFKQCDLKEDTTFIKPEVVHQTEDRYDDISYLPFKREGSEGCWAGVNNYGVSFVAADSYLELADNDELVLRDVHDDIFTAYLDIISKFKTAKDAADHMITFYKSFMQPDILLISDERSSYFIETYNGNVECIERTDNFFASTNHFRMLYDGVLYPNNHSTYLRLARAESILQNQPDANGVINVLRDQYYGESVFSVCRKNINTPPQEEPFFTQASAIFYTNGHTVNCLYQINGNPREKLYTSIEDVFGAHRVTEEVREFELERILVGSDVMMTV